MSYFVITWDNGAEQIVYGRHQAAAVLDAEASERMAASIEDQPPHRVVDAEPLDASAALPTHTRHAD